MVPQKKKHGVFITNFNWLMEIMAIHQESCPNLLC